MTHILLKFTTVEVELLTDLASEQLFRREFIDPKMPGHKPKPLDIKLGKQLVERLRLSSDRANKVPVPRRPTA